MAESKKKTAGTASKSTSAKSKTSLKKTPAKAKKPTAAEQEALQAQFKERRRFWSLILFFFGVFEIIVTFIKGDGLWGKLYSFNRGMLGMSVFVFGFFVIYMALSIAGEKSRSSVISRAIQGGAMFFLLAGAAQIFFGGEIVGESFLQKLKCLYTQGTELEGGGVAGAVLGWSMQALFGDIGSKIMIVMLILLCTLLLSNLTLPQVFRGIARPFVGAAKALKEDSSERAAERGVSAYESKPLMQAPDPDYAQYDGYTASVQQEQLRAQDSRRAAPRQNVNTPAKKPRKKRSIDFAKVHQAQLERISCQRYCLTRIPRKRNGQAKNLKTPKRRNCLRKRRRKAGSQSRIRRTRLPHAPK